MEAPMATQRTRFNPDQPEAADKERRRDQPVSDAQRRCHIPATVSSRAGRGRRRTAASSSIRSTILTSEDLGPEDFEEMTDEVEKDRHQDRHLTRVEFTGVACDHAVMNISSLLSPNGRLARGPFVPAVIAVYVASFLSQVLLSPSVTARAGVALFVLTQIVLIWIWMVLHTRRLRDAGRPTGIVIGIAMIYVLEVALLVLLVWLILGTAGPTGGASSEASIFHLFVFLYFLGLLTGDPTLASCRYG
jgi:uncharacterized membrane protein YhaH (DUF805 family)